MAVSLFSNSFKTKSVRIISLNKQIKNLLMKIFTNVLVVLAVALIIFNITLLDFKHPFQGDSVVAFIGISASFCAVLILLIFKTSKKIEEKMNNKL
jgi:Mg2+ and Co2+ transporter CorA